MPYEFDLLVALRGAGIRVPRVLLVETGDALRHPFVMMECLAGSAKKADSLRSDGREIGVQMAQQLAAIHQLDARIARRPEWALTPKSRLLSHIDYAYRLWTSNQTEPSSVVERAFYWVRTNIDCLREHSVLVHGDYDLRNLLLDGAIISAVLDWERSHIGHPAEDLAYCRSDIEKLMPWGEFLTVYESCGGKDVSEEELKYFSIWANIFRMISITRAHYGFAHGEHSDFLLGSASYIERNQVLGVLSRQLSELDPPV
jgi:aminoglycoside phosphotransferase (APT) family kinase protein